MPYIGKKPENIIATAVDTTTGDFSGNVTAGGTLAVTGAITSSDGATITTADNTAQLSLISTDADANSGPELDLYRNSSSPADADLMGKVTFRGRNDNSQDVNYGQIVARAEDASDGTEDGRVDFRAIIGGTEGTFMKYHVPSGNEVVFNDGSLDIDFRVESNSLANMLFVDGGNDKIYIGRDANDGKFSSKLQIESNDSTAGMSMHRASNDSGPPYLAMSKSRLGNFADDTLVQSGDGLGTIYWSGADGTDRGSGACYIAGVVDGTPGSDDMPGRLVFATTADGDTSPTERMRIDSGGSTTLRTTAAAGVYGITLLASDSNARFDISRSGTSAASMMRFGNTNGFIGSITTSGTSTAYNTSSDYRLKENVNYDWDATTELKKLKPAKFNFKADTDTTVQGFLAHEVSSIVPEAITGDKDATEDLKNVVLLASGVVSASNVTEEEWKIGKSTTDTDGNSKTAIYPSDSIWKSTHTAPVYQAISQDKLVPLLTKALQEQQATIEALTARIVTLENA